MMKKTILVLMVLVSILCSLAVTAYGETSTVCILNSEFFSCVEDMDIVVTSPKGYACCDRPNTTWHLSYMDHIGNTSDYICHTHKYYGIRYCKNCGEIYNATPVLYRTTTGCGQVFN